MDLIIAIKVFFFISPPYTFQGRITYINSYYSYKVVNNFISIPIAFALKLFTIDKFALFADIGLSEDYLFSKKVPDFDFHLQGTNIYPDYGITSYNKYSTESNLGLTVNYKFNEKMNIYLKPNFNYFITKNLVEYRSVRQNNYYFGLDLGIRVSINGH